jgi:hypothetical protein
MRSASLKQFVPDPGIGRMRGILILIQWAHLPVP